MWSQDDGHSAVQHKVIDRYSDGDLEVALVERQIVDGAVDYILHVKPKTFTTSGIQWTHFLEWLGFRYFNNCPHVLSHCCLWRKWDSNTTDAEKIVRTLKEAYQRVKEGDELLSETPLKLPESNLGWLYFLAPEDMKRHGLLMRWLAEL